MIGVPLWLLVALAIKLDSRGPVLYVDRRIGVGEHEFGMLKFRTMTADAAERQDELEEANEATGALFKIRDDPRITRVGRVLRRLSIDELPQLVNVLRGQMSLVGPRPLPLRDHALLEEWHKARYHVLPGMTGLWQISGRSGLEFDDLVRLDFTYIENWSIWSRRLDHREDHPRRAHGARRVLAAPALARPRRRPERRSHGNDQRDAYTDASCASHASSPSRPPSTSTSATAARPRGGSCGRGCTRPGVDLVVTPVPRPAGRVALVAHRAEPDVPRGRDVRGRCGTGSRG